MSEFPNRRKLEPTGIENTYDVVRAEGNVTETGDMFDDAAMNDLESRIESGLSDAAISTYTHTKTGTVHALTGSGNKIEFKATADFAEGDTWTVNGQSVTAALQNGEPLPADMFKSGNWVTGVRLDGDKLGFRAAGGDGVTYNVFCQPTEPVTKDGIWLKTATSIKPKKIVFDDNIWAAEGWQDPSLVADMLIARSNACCAAMDNEIFIFSGQYGTFSYTSSVIAYNPSTNAYKSISYLDIERSDACCAAMGNEIFIFGGAIAANDNLRSAIAYKPSTNTYRALANMPKVKAEVCCAVMGNEIFIFGGNENGNTLIDTIAYKPSTNTYRTLANMPIARQSACCAVMGNEIFIFGGHLDNVGATDTAIAYKPSTNTYRTISKMPKTKITACCAVVDHEIFIFGGYLNEATTYNPSTNTYRALANMTDIRQGACCGILGNKIFVFGGTSGMTYLKSVDCMELTAKQYPNNPSLLIHAVKRDTTFSTNLLQSKLIDMLPIYFKDSMLFADGDITFPALYIGDGTQWTLARAAQ